MKSFLIILPLLLIHSTSGLISFGECPNITPIVLDPFKFLGVWYEYEKLPLDILDNFLAKPASCVTSNFYSDGSSKVNTTQTRTDGVINTITGTVVYLDSNKFTVTNPGIFPFNQATYMVLATDYENCSIIYNCDTLLNLVKRERLYIWTKPLNVTESSLINCNNVINNLGLGLLEGQLIKSDRSGCSA